MKHSLGGTANLGTSAWQRNKEQLHGEERIHWKQHHLDKENQPGICNFLEELYSTFLKDKLFGHAGDFLQNEWSNLTHTWNIFFCYCLSVLPSLIIILKSIIRLFQTLFYHFCVYSHKSGKKLVAKFDSCDCSPECYHATKNAGLKSERGTAAWKTFEQRLCSGFLTSCFTFFNIVKLLFSDLNNLETG